MTIIDDLIYDLPTWQVRFNGDFLNFQGRGNPGQEMTLLREFDLSCERWLLAAVYCCGPGLVVDFCRKIGPDDSYTSEIRAEITVNGRKLAPSHGFGEAWNPSLLAEITTSPCNTDEAEVEYDLITDEECQDDEFAYLKPALAVLSHYDIDPEIGWQFLLMCDKEAIEVQKILPFLSDTWPLCRIGRAVIRASQSCRQSCNKSQCPACGCRSHHSCTHAPQFSRSFPAREWGSVLQRQGACGQCP